MKSLNMREELKEEEIKIDKKENCDSISSASLKYIFVL
jgi:hypothetical protein